MKFTKMHGSGNDYVYINCFEERIDNPQELAVIISDRHRGVGSDGLVLIMPSDNCDFRMRMFNADGSEAGMCGNASRCVGKYIYDNRMTDKTELLLETLSGIKHLYLYPEGGKVKKVQVDMGEPILKSAEIPVALPVDTVIDCPVHFFRTAKNITCVSMGNPHTVIFERDVDSLNISEIGREIEQHPVFPERTNVEFVECLSPTHLKMRVWERGSAETQACGTGACAALVAAVLNGKTERKAIVSLPGGELEIEWNEDDNHVYLMGDAVSVFNGEWKMKPPPTPPREGLRARFVNRNFIVNTSHKTLKNH